MSQYWMLDESGDPKGPFSANQLQDWMQEGRLTGKELICHEGGEEWVAIAACEGLGSSPSDEERRSASASAPSPEDMKLPTPAEAGEAAASSTRDRGPSMSPPPQEPRRRTRSRLPASESLADRVLQVAFSIGRWVSIVFVSLMILAIVGSIVAISYLSIPQGAIDVEQPSAPSASSFVAECLQELEKKQVQRDMNQDRFSSASSREVTNPTISERDMVSPCEIYRARISAVVDRLRIQGDSDSEINEQLCRVILDFAPKEREWFADSLLEFAKEWNASTESAPTGCDGGAAVNWFIQRSRLEIQKRDLEYRQRMDEQMSTRLAREQGRTLAVQVLGVGICSITLFLVLPLLIQIERHMRGLAAAARNPPT